MNLVELRPVSSPVAPISARPVTVRSPHLPVATDGYCGSTALPPVADARAQAPPPSLSTARKFMLAGVAALSIGGGIFGGIIAQHGAGIVQMQQETRSAPQLVDAMIDAGRNGREVPDSLRQAVHAQLDKLPPDVVRAVAANGTKIAIMRNNETPMDVGVIKDLPADRLPAADKLRVAADQAFADAAREHKPRIEALEARLEALKAHAREVFTRHPDMVPKPQGLSGVFSMAQMGGDVTSLDPAVQKCASELAKARVDQLRDAWKAIDQAAGGRVEPFAIDVPAGLGGLGGLGGMMGMMPFSVEGIAMQHGARSPEDIKRFSDLMVALNGDRLTAAQDAYQAQTKAAIEVAQATAKQRLGPSGAPTGGMMGGMGGMTGGLGGLMGGMVAPPAGDAKPLSVSQRPFMAGEAQVVVPSIYFVHRTDDPAEHGRIVDKHDFQSLNQWASGSTIGQYWYQPDRKTIVLREKEVLEDSPEMSTTVHEFGHAYMSALEARDPKFQKSFIDKWNGTFEKNLDDSHNPFPSRYARTNSSEFFAESFSAHFGTQHAQFEARDPNAAGLMRDALSDASNAARPR